MFRTGHRTDHLTAVEPAAQPTPEPEPATEPAPRDEPAARVAARQTTSAGAAEATMGRGVRFDGTLKFSGTMRLDGGTFSGKITSGDRLVIGDGATLEAQVVCGSIEVHGEAHGSLTARESVELHAPARVTADVTAPSFVVEKGVLFEGTVQMRGAGKSARAPRAPREVAEVREPS